MLNHTSNSAQEFLLSTQKCHFLARTLVKETNRGSKMLIDILLKFRFSSKILISVKNSNFGQKLQFWSKSLMLAKKFNFGQKYIQKKLDRLGQRVFILPTPKTFSFLVINIKNVKSNFFRSNSAHEFPYSKIHISVKNQNFGQKF